MRVNDCEALFLGGLLHDIGKLFLYSMFTQTYDQVLKYAQDKQIPVLEAEAKMLGLTHGEIGATMASTWKLPQLLGEIISRHEGPFKEGDAPSLFAVHVGDRLTQHLYHQNEGVVAAAIEPLAEEWLDLTAGELESGREGSERGVER